MATIISEYSAGDFEAITVAATAIGFTVAKLLTSDGRIAQEVFCTLETGEIRFRLDGTDPTAAVGHILSIGQTLTLKSVGDLTNFSAIRTGGTSGALKVTYRY